MEIEATIQVTIKHVSGPVVEDTDHVRRWICADGQYYSSYLAGFTYEVCPAHDDPDECSESCGTSIYAATVLGATWGDES